MEKIQIMTGLYVTDEILINQKEIVPALVKDKSRNSGGPEHHGKRGSQNYLEFE